jgi:hypothetical protein
MNWPRQYWENDSTEGKRRPFDPVLQRTRDEGGPAFGKTSVCCQLECLRLPARVRPARRPRQLIRIEYHRPRPDRQNGLQLVAVASLRGKPGKKAFVVPKLRYEARDRPTRRSASDWLDHVSAPSAR